MIKEVWCVTGMRNGFELKLYLEGTEEQLRDYLATEVEGVVFDRYHYSACWESEIELVKKLNIHIYYM